MYEGSLYVKVRNLKNSFPTGGKKVGEKDSIKFYIDERMFILKLKKTSDALEFTRLVNSLT